MPHALIDKYLDERDSLLNTVNVLKNTAAERGSDPTDQDLKIMSDAYERVDRLDKMIAVVGQDRDMDDEARAKLLNPTPPTPSGFKYRSGGEMLWDALHANYGLAHDTADQDARRRWETVMKRAAQHMGAGDPSLTTPVAGGVGGLFVVPVVGPVINLYPQNQPFLSAIGRRPAPSSMTFTRPRIVDPDFETGVGVQSLQKAELASKKFDVKIDTLSLKTVGGYLNVSQQLMSLNASAWDLIVSQLQARLAWAGEAALVTEIDQTGASVSLAAAATSAQVLAALFQAASLVYQNTRQLPSWIAYGPVGWARLGALTDTAGRPLFPFLGASNAMGSASLGDFNLGPLGLQQIVTPAITDGTIYVGNNFGVEAYVYSFPVLEAVEPSLLGRQVAVAEALCFWRPTTKEAVTGGTPAPAEQNGIVKIVAS